MAEGRRSIYIPPVASPPHYNSLVFKALMKKVSGKVKLLLVGSVGVFGTLAQADHLFAGLPWEVRGCGSKQTVQ